MTGITAIRSVAEMGYLYNFIEEVPHARSHSHAGQGVIDRHLVA